MNINFPCHALNACALACLAFSAQAQTNRAPFVNYWMDVATYSFMGMEERTGLMGMMMDRMGRGEGPVGRDGKKPVGIGNFGYADQGSFGRYVDISVHSSRQQIQSAQQTVPSNAKLGGAPLQIMLPPREAVPPVESSPSGQMERPKGRILFYWGCGATVRSGQPRVVDFSRLGEADWTGFINGRYTQDKGARFDPGHAIWPNEKQNSKVMPDNSLLGTHQISGDGIPADMRFTLGEGYDQMPPLRLSAAGKPEASINVTWPNLPSARAYMLGAFGFKGQKGNTEGADMIIWSSSEPPETGFGLMNFVSNRNADNWLREKVLLPAGSTSCAIPAGIFAESAGTMVRGIAYGNEFYASQPKPQNAPSTWAPDWGVRVRYKSTGMAMLGMDANAMAGAGGGAGSGGGERNAGEAAGSALPGRAGALGGILGGILGGGGNTNPPANAEKPAETANKPEGNTPNPAKAIGNVLGNIFGR